ncbi:MAG: aminomethyltransferase beta-barrel domain-containing protein [Microthrixaceae bacterium]
MGGPLSGSPPQDRAVTVQTSAHGRAYPAHLGRSDPDEGSLEITWVEPRRAVAAGQSVVVYDGDEVVAGGTAA